jgi:hemolysin activation/secretion protein
VCDEANGVESTSGTPTRSMKPWVAGLLVALSPLAARAAGPVVPGAGTLLQDLKPLEPPAPSDSEPGLQIEQGGRPTLPASAPFLVRAIHISGNASFDTPTLHALVAEAEGKELRLPELDERVARITDFYRARGYPLARAIIPAQTIRDGVVSIEVIEARYGRILLDNHSRVSDGLLQATLSPLKSGQVIGQSDLDHGLLLLTDIPGAVTSATLKPGEAAGTSDLLVQVVPGPAVAENLTLDNYGNRYTGRARIGGELSLNDPLHHGDVLDASVQSSGRDMDYGRLLYDVLLDGQGTHLGGSYSAIHYILAGSLASLDGHGTADVESLWVKQPLMRARELNLYGQLQFDRKQLSDDIDVSSIHTDRHLDNWIASLSGDARDSMVSGGINTWSLGLTSGQLGYDDSAAQHADAATAKTQGRFLQWNVTLARLQSLTAKDALYVAVSGQWANANLDPSQKMVAGGPYTVRAYDMSAVSGDIGVQASAEWRHDLARTWHGQWQSVAFLDGERVSVNKSVWMSGINEATLSGAGLELNWTGSNQWSAKASIATRLGSTPVLVGATSSIRAWIDIGKGF